MVNYKMLMTYINARTIISCFWSSININIILQTQSEMSKKDRLVLAVFTDRRFKKISTMIESKFQQDKALL